MSTVPSVSGEPQGAFDKPVDYSGTLKFLDLLFTGMAGGFIEFRHIAAGRKLTAAGQVTYLPLPLERERIVSAVLGSNGQQTITFGPAPRYRIPARGAGGKEHHVLQVGCVWATFAHRRFKGGLIEVLRRVRDLPLRPSVVVSGGYDHHVFFVLNSPLHGHLLLEWSEVIGELGAALQCSAPGDISQKIALPGTLNLEEDVPVECEVVEELSSWTRYGLDELRQAINSMSVHGHSRHTPLPAEFFRQHGLSQQLVEAVVTGHLAGRLGPRSSGLGSESGRDFQIACALFEQGCDGAEIKTLFRLHPHGCGSKWARKRDGERYLDSLLRKVAASRQERQDCAPSAGTDADDGPPESNLPPCYEQHADGSLWFHPPVSDEGRKVPKPVKVCNSPLQITEIRENVDTGRISLVVSFTYLRKTVTTPILRSQMSDPRQLVAALSDVGAPFTALNARSVTAYLAAYEHTFADSIRRKKVTSSFGRGRRGSRFFFPGLSADVEFVPAGAGDAALHRAYASRRGTLQGWLEAAYAVARENLLIPQVAILAALVPPLQRKLQLPNFILDLHGNTSTGKSTSLRLAASVYGRPRDPDSLLLQWLNTSTAVEQVAAVCDELPVFLDDAQHCPAEMKRSVIYMIANGRGKGRGGRGGVRETPTWHTVALSTSEEPLYEASPHEGARGRILSIGGLVPPFRPGAGAMVHAVERAVSDNHGHAGLAYIRHLNGWTEQEWSRWQRRYSEISKELQRGSSSNLADRVSGYIAAVQLAGEVACPLLGLPFQPDVVGAWLMLHLAEQQQEQNMVLVALRALADYYVAHGGHFVGDGRYTPDQRVAIQGVVKVQQYVGFLRSTVEAVCKARRWNATTVLNKLAAAGVLHATERDRHTKKVSVEGMQHRMVCVKWSALLHDDDIVK